jgi:predicted esterase
MASKSALLLLSLGIGVGTGTLAATAQVIPPLARVARPAAPQLDEARLAAMRKAIREHARRVNPEDLAKPPSQAKPLHPLISDLDRAPPAGSDKKSDKLSSQGTQRSVSFRATVIEATSHSGAPATSRDQGKAAGSAGSAGKQVSSSAKTSSQPSNPSPAVPEQPAPILRAGYHPSVFVSRPGRLDWTYVVSDSSLDPAPGAMTAGYVSTRQTYELYVPPDYNPLRPCSLIIHVATGPRSDSWAQWQNTCRAHHVILAGAHNAGNLVPTPLRARITLDVLDDVRRRFRIDPDRTYISGMSGGGKTAAEIAFALPELFGGLVAICGCWNLRAEPMMRQRVSDRLSVALLTGAMDFNRPELEREFYPILCQHGARSLLQVYPGIGHSYPNAAQLDQVFRWMEQGLGARRVSGALFPASRLTAAATPSDWSTALVLEASQRVELPGGMAPGLFLLQGVVNRWQGLPAANLAQNLLDEFDKSSPVPSKEIYRTEVLRFRYLQAHMFDGIVNGPLPPNYPVPRSNLVNIAVWLWTDILNLSPKDSPVAREASGRLAQLHRLGG